MGAPLTNPSRVAGASKWRGGGGCGVGAVHKISERQGPKDKVLNTTIVKVIYTQVHNNKI